MAELERYRFRPLTISGRAVEHAFSRHFSQPARLGSRVWCAITGSGSGQIWAFVVLLLLLGNGKAVVGPALPAGGLVGVAIGLVVSVGSLAYAWRAGLTPAQLGLGHWRTAPLSLVLGLLVVGLPLLAVRLTTEIGIPLPVPPPPPGLEEVPREALLQRIGLYLPFDTVLLEEFAFRGVLLAVLYRRLRPNGEIALVSLAPTHSGSKKAHRLAMAGAVLGVTLCFVLWHVCLNWSETPGDLLLFLGKLGAYAAGGLAFTLPLISRNLVGCFTAHWLADAVLMLIAHPEGQWLREIVLPQRL